MNKNMSCKNCSCFSCADGSNPPQTDMMAKLSQIGTSINTYIFDGKGTKAQVKDAYAKVMVFLDSKSLPQTDQSIKDNQVDIKAAINDPAFLEKHAAEIKADETTSNKFGGYKKVAIIIVAAIVIIFILKKL